ncbi:unnamed protein product [Moneuplotes crassus]|uniref:Uncharacterized protein n=1 Tax=Euplotes crassus TaxID=5936 RepID=A0AAD1X3E2_EUPCR|nr:unnamed protein product [Moneuplotes crassus]
MIKFQIFQLYFTDIHDRILVDICFIFLKSYLFELVLIDKEPRKFFETIQDACNDQKEVTLKSQSMKLIEYSCELRSKHRNFVIKFSLELIGEYIDRISANPASFDINPNALKYMGQASIAKSKFIRNYCNSNFIMHSSTEELLDVSLIILSSLSYLIVKRENWKSTLMKRIHQLGPIIISNGSKLIKCRFVLLMGYYSDIFLKTKVSLKSFASLHPKKDHKLLKFEEILKFLCECCTLPDALAHQAIDALQSIVNDNTIAFYVKKNPFNVIDILIKAVKDVTIEEFFNLIFVISSFDSITQEQMVSLVKNCVTKIQQQIKILDQNNLIPKVIIKGKEILEKKEAHIISQLWKLINNILKVCDDSIVKMIDPLIQPLLDYNRGSQIFILEPEVYKQKGNVFTDKIKGSFKILIKKKEILTPEIYETLIEIIKGGGNDFWRDIDNIDYLLEIAKINIFCNFNDYHVENIFGCIFLQKSILYLKKYLIIDEVGEEMTKEISNLVIPKSKITFVADNPPTPKQQEDIYETYLRLLQTDSFKENDQASQHEKEGPRGLAKSRGAEDKRLSLDPYYSGSTCFANIIAKNLIKEEAKSKDEEDNYSDKPKSKAEPIFSLNASNMIDNSVTQTSHLAPQVNDKLLNIIQSS